MISPLCLNSKNVLSSKSFTMQRVPSCSYCFKPYAFKGSGRPVGQCIPRLLSCGHTFCDGCVTKLAGIQPHVLQCPTCKQQTQLPGGKKQIKNLPTNLYILGILINNVRVTIEKDFTKGELSDFDLDRSFYVNPKPTTYGGLGETVGASREKPPGEDGGKVCDECCKKTAINECQKCDAIFCQNCFDTVHSSSRTLRSHEAIPLSLSNLAEVSSQTCETHEGRQLEFFDRDTAKLVCSLCIVTSAYQGHKIVSAHELTREIAEKVEQRLQNVKKVQKQLQKSKCKLSLMFPEIKAIYSEDVQHIRERFQDLHAELQAREIAFIKEVKDVYCCKSFPDEVAKEITQHSVELGTLVEQGTAALSAPSSLMRIGETLLSKMADFEDIPCILSKSFLQDLVQVSFPKEFEDALSLYGTIVSKDCGVKLKKLSEVADDVDDEHEEQGTFSKNTGLEDELKEGESPTKAGGTLLTTPSRQNLVTVSNLKTPCNFSVQYVADRGRLENLMDAINRYCEGSKSLNDTIKSTQVGDLVCAQYSQDQSWYRARVISEQQRASVPKGHNQSLPKVKVCFIDYGDTEMVPLNKLRKIRPEFADIPELATTCSLVDIVPPSQCETWPSDSNKAFGSLVHGKEQLMSVVKKSGGKLFVDLKCPEEEPTKDDDKPASVRDALVFLDVAHFSCPTSVANPEVTFPVRTYRKVVMPQEGESVLVIVTYTEAPDSLYVMEASGKGYSDTLKILGQMKAMYSLKKGNQWKIVCPYKGLVCAARFTGDKDWYRALVTSVTDDQMVQVLYVDFGNSEVLPVSEIRRMPDHMTQNPMQAMKCRLAGVQPIDLEKGWSNESCTFLSDNCPMNQYNMKVVEAEGDLPMAVVLLQADAQQTTSLNQQLVLNSYAVVSSSDDNESLQIVNVEEPSSPASNASTRVSEGDENTSGIDIAQGQLLYPRTLCYQPVEMPTSNNFLFAVSYVDQDCTISGYQPDKGDESLPELMKHMQKICSAKDLLPVTQDQLSFNQPCCAEYSDDNLWYRAQIIDFPTPSSVLVDYVDFGNRAEIPLTSINLNAAFLDIPKQCLSIHLVGLPQTPDVQRKLAKVLDEMLVGKICKATTSTKSTVHGVLKVDHLSLSDGTDVVNAAGAMMSRRREAQHEETKEKEPSEQIPSKSTHQQLPKKVKPAAESGQSLVSDTVIPSEGVPFVVTVTQINTKSVLYLQRAIQNEGSPDLVMDYDPTAIIAGDHIRQMIELSNKINLLNYFNGKPNVSNVWKNMLCCARYTEDDLWYRAEVTEVVSNDPLQARVLYFDYGTSEEIGLDRMKPFPAALVSLPKQAFQCTVLGLDELDDDDEDGDQQKAIDALANAVADKKLICKVVSSGPPIVVELYERVFNEQSYEDVPISQRLSELNQMVDEVDDSESSDDSQSTKQSSEQEESAAKEENKPVDDEDEDFSADVKPVGDWYSECEDTFMKYDREGVLTRPQLLTPAQFLLKKDSSGENEKAVKSEVQAESEVD